MVYCAIEVDGTWYKVPGGTTTHPQQSLLYRMHVHLCRVSTTIPPFFTTIVHTTPHPHSSLYQVFTTIPYHGSREFSTTPYQVEHLTTLPCGSPHHMQHSSPRSRPVAARQSTTSIPGGTSSASSTRCYRVHHTTCSIDHHCVPSQWVQRATPPLPL